MRNIVILSTVGLILFITTGVSETAGRVDADSAWGRFYRLNSWTRNDQERKYFGSRAWVLYDCKSKVFSLSNDGA